MKGSFRLFQKKKKKNMSFPHCQTLNAYTCELTYLQALMQASLNLGQCLSYF
jgi:hypothetical protein